MMIYYYQCPKCKKITVRQTGTLEEPRVFCPNEDCKATRCSECGGYHKDATEMQRVGKVMLHKEMI
jgi:uncharacterized Zn finger protein